MRIEELETPAIVVDLDILEANLQRMADYSAAHGLSLRPHTKTHKIPAIAHMQLRLGSGGITVAKVGEAEVMAAAGVDDILVHYPVLGQSQLQRLARLASDRKITVAIDSSATAQAMSNAAKEAGSTIYVLVELDTGMRRCGVSSASEALSLAQLITGLPGLELAGLTTYPGHIWVAPGEQASSLRQVGEKLQEARTLLLRSGISCETVSAGSTPTAFNTHLAEGLTEMRPGTYVFNDRNTAGVGAVRLEDCALRVLVTVVSTAVSGRAIVDGGSKTFSSDRSRAGGDTGHGYIVEQPAVEFAAMSEEHGHLDLNDSGYSPRVGDKLSVIPNHVCPCVNMHDALYYHRNGVVEGCWQVAGRGKVR